MSRSEFEVTICGLKEPVTNCDRFPRSTAILAARPNGFSLNRYQTLPLVLSSLYDDQ